MSATAVPVDSRRLGGITPDRSIDQRMEALEKANAIRSRRARLKVDIAAGLADVRDLVRDPPEFVLTMRLRELLVARPGFGSEAANKVLLTARVSPTKSLGGLTDRQRSAVVAALTDQGANRRAQRASRGKPKPGWAARAAACSRCENPLQRASASGLCGFCEEGI